MINTPLIKGHYQPAPDVFGRPRLLIVSDSHDRLAGLRDFLSTCEIEITSARSVEEISLACRGRLDVVVVDIGPTGIVEALKTIRAHLGCAWTSILVEASRLPTDPRLAGILTKYRAMPCSHDELIRLARRRMMPGADRRRTKKVL